MPIDPDNPLLTSYAFGELDSAESAEVESLLAADESARRFVGDLRATAALLQDELAQESSPGLDDARRAVIFAQESETVQSLRLQLADAADAEPRTDVYRVITHPSPRAGRDRRELLAIAASVAIVATTLTLIFSSLFRGPASPSIVTNTQPTSQPLPLIFPQTQVAIDQSAEFPDSFISRPPRDLLAPSFAGPETSPLPFGVNGALSVTRIQIPSTHESPTTAYAVTFENPFVDASRYPLSTFSFDVGNNSYAAIRGALNHGRRPDKADIRIEQLINFFPYDYATPPNGQAFAAHIEVAPCPWQTDHRLVRIGLKARELPQPGPIATNLQIQVEFNPSHVGAYRLIGYDRRLITRNFQGDPTKHNQITAGQSVTALYELIPAGAVLSKTNELKYQTPPQPTSAAQSNELLTLQLHFQDPASSRPASQTFAAPNTNLASPSEDFNLAAAVAAFGLLLQDSPHKSNASYDLVLTLAQSAQRRDSLGERAKFIELVQQARRI